VTTPFAMHTDRQPLVEGDRTASVSFYRFLQNLFQAAGGGGQTASITVGTSPYVYTAASTGQVIVQGGTVSKIEFSRDAGTTFLDTGVTQGMFLLNAQDQLKVTYSVKPTMTWVPK